MTGAIKNHPREEFAADVLAGFSAAQKFLSSKYFYDTRGDELFRQIMQLEEYYVSRCETEILENQSGSIYNLLKDFKNEEFNLVELGAGDGSKTKILIHELLRRGANLSYVPIDISANAVSLATQCMKFSFPSLNVRGVHGDYFRQLDSLEKKSRNVILFMGANIGNYSQKEASGFLSKLCEHLSAKDLLIIGFDLKKDPDRILSAYNDKKGVTSAFNLNLLHRINNELEGTFDINKFKHYPIYDAVSGEARSYLMSLSNQKVWIGSLKKWFCFEEWETIHTEISKKYTCKEIEQLADNTGFIVREGLSDSGKNFNVSIWIKK